MNANERLAYWAATVSGEHTSTALERATNAVIDTIACMLIGFHDPASRRAFEAVAEWGGGCSSVIGYPHQQLPAPWAALVNGTSAHALDFDDYNEVPSFAHPSAVLFPALLAIAEEKGKSGSEVLDAFIVGVEALMRIGEAVNIPHYSLGWHATATIGTLAAAVSSARLLGLKADAISAALSIATSHAAGYTSQFGTMTKPLHCGFAAQAGVLAAQLAAQNITASTSTLDGKWSFSGLLSTEEAQGFDAPLAKLGQILAIDEYGLSIKRYPCCSAMHCLIDAVLEQRAGYKLIPSEVEAVTVRLRSTYVDILPFVFPKNDAEARFSLTYCLATALVTGDLQPDDFSRAAVERSEIRALIPLITIEKHAFNAERGPKAPSDILIIKLKNGQIIEKVADRAVGMPDCPLSRSELMKKFSRCAWPVLGDEQCRQVQSLLQNFEGLQDITELMKLLRG